MTSGVRRAAEVAVDDPETERPPRGCKPRRRGAGPGHEPVEDHEVGAMLAQDPACPCWRQRSSPSMESRPVVGFMPKTRSKEAGS